MIILICLDVDGTLDSSNGPVRWEALKHLAAGTGAVLRIVSPSNLIPPNTDGFRCLHPSGQRHDNLRLARDELPQAALRLYVSDNNDRAAAELAGFAYVDAKEFSWGL